MENIMIEDNINEMIKEKKKDIFINNKEIKKLKEKNSKNEEDVKRGERCLVFMDKLKEKEHSCEESLLAMKDQKISSYNSPSVGSCPLCNTISCSYCGFGECGRHTWGSRTKVLTCGTCYEKHGCFSCFMEENGITPLDFTIQRYVHSARYSHGVIHRTRLKDLVEEYKVIMGKLDNSEVNDTKIPIPVSWLECYKWVLENLKKMDDRESKTLFISV